MIARPIKDTDGGYIDGDGNFVSLDDALANHTDDRWVQMNAKSRKSRGE